MKDKRILKTNFEIVLPLLKILREFLMNLQ